MFFILLMVSAKAHLTKEAHVTMGNISEMVFYFILLNNSTPLPWGDDVSIYLEVKFIIRIKIELRFFFFFLVWHWMTFSENQNLAK